MFEAHHEKLQRIQPENERSRKVTIEVNIEGRFETIVVAVAGLNTRAAS